MSTPEVVIDTATVDRAQAFMRLPATYRPVLTEALQLIGQQAIEYTRGAGFSSAGVPGPTAKSIIIKAGARLAANAEQTRRDVGNVSVRSYFDGWDPVEKKLLDSLRRVSR